MLSQLLAQFLPALIDALTPMLVAVIAALIYRWTGVQVEQKHMLALQSALQNGARLLLAGKTVDDAIDYVARSVPDALATFRSGDRARIAELLAPHIAVLPVPGGGPAVSVKALNRMRAHFLGAGGGKVSTQ